MFVVYLAHHLRAADVTVPCDGLTVLTHFIVLQFASSPSPQIVVVIQNPDLRRQSVLLEQGAKCPNELHLIFLSPDTGGHSAVLVGVYFVLRGDGLDWNSSLRVGLQGLHKILSIGANIATLHRSTQHGTSGLHPTGWAPWRRKEKQLGIRFPRFPKYRQDVFSVVVD